MNRFSYAHSRIFVLTGIVVFGMLLPPFSHSQNYRSASDSGVSNTPAGRGVLEYLDALNSGDREIVQDYIRGHYDPLFLNRFPMDIHITILMSYYYESAGLGYEFHSMRNSEADGLNAVLYNKLTGSWVNLIIPHTEKLPHKINNIIYIKPASPPPDVKRSKNPRDEEIIERLELCLAKLVEDDEFSGAVLVARNGIPLLKKGYGMASKSYRIKNRADTKFNIASLGKMFTGVAVAQLAERGKLSFEDPVSKYLSSDWIKPEIGEKIQIRHLLTHTSGFGTYFRELYMQTEQPFFRNIDDYKILIADDIPAFEPGTKWSYSNTGMHLLGVVIEKVTGESYFDYIRENIYEPAGMLNTDAYDKDIPLPNRATNYTKEYSDKGAVFRTGLFTRVMKGGPSGGGFSTVEDLLKFDIALRSHKLLGPEYTELVLTAKPEINSPFYGYGFFVSRGDAGRIAEHSGNGTGISSQFKMYLDKGYTVAVLSNYGRPAADIVGDVIHQMIIAQ